VTDETKKKPLSDKQIEQRRLAGSKSKTMTMTDAAIAQRQAAAQNSTGPTTEEGKTAASLNAWKHGRYAAINNRWRDIGMGSIDKPCKSTCDMYPCELVESGQTQPGGTCLNKTIYLEAFNSLMEILSSEDAEASHGLMASQVAGAIEIMQNLKDYISKNGIIIEQPIFNKIGLKIGEVDVINPALNHYMQMMDKLGLNLPELMATPKAIKGSEGDKDALGAVHELIGRIGRAGGANNGPVKHRTFDVTPDKEDE
jgi:hypothetical protein